MPLPPVVTVTATLAGTGVGLAGDVAGGVDRDGCDDGDVQPVALRPRACIPVLPVDPAVTQATCTAGEVTVPTMVLASTPAGVTYVADPAGSVCRHGGDAGDGDGDVVGRVGVGDDAAGVDVWSTRRRRRSR